MNLDLYFFVFGLLGFWHINGQNALVKGRINLVSLYGCRQLYLPFKGTSVPFNKEVMLILVFSSFLFFAPDGENVVSDT